MLPVCEGLGHHCVACQEHGGGGGLLAGVGHRHLADGPGQGRGGICIQLLKEEAATVVENLSMGEGESSAWGPAPLRAQDNGPGQGVSCVSAWGSLSSESEGWLPQGFGSCW